MCLATHFVTRQSYGGLITTYLVIPIFRMPMFASQVEFTILSADRARQGQKALQKEEH